MYARLLGPTLASMAIACAPIEVTSTPSVQPRSAPILLGEQVVDRSLVVDWVQLGARVLVEVEEQRLCAGTHHVPVTRVEEIERKAGGFIAWDFAIAGLTGGLAALAFGRPQTFSPRLISSDGRTTIDPTNAYLVGGIFAGIAGLLLAAGIVNSVKARDETRYADAYRVDLGPVHRCAGDGGHALGEVDLELTIGGGAVVRRARSDERGRARFELPSRWPAEFDPPKGPIVGATLAIVGDSRVLTLDLHVPWEGMVEAHTGRTETTPIDSPLPSQLPAGFGAPP